MKIDKDQRSQRLKKRNHYGHKDGGNEVELPAGFLLPAHDLAVWKKTVITTNSSANYILETLYSPSRQ